MAGVRVLDLRLAVSQWLRQEEQQQQRGPAAGRLLKGLAPAVSSSKLAASLVTSHSLPGPPLAEVLADVRRFLQEHPSEVRVAG